MLPQGLKIKKCLLESKNGTNVVLPNLKNLSSSGHGIVFSFFSTDINLIFGNY